MSTSIIRILSFKEISGGILGQVFFSTNLDGSRQTDEDCKKRGFELQGILLVVLLAMFGDLKEDRNRVNSTHFLQKGNFIRRIRCYIWT